VVGKSGKPRLLINLAMKIRIAIEECLISERMIDAKPIFCGAPSPIAPLAMAQTPKVNETSLFLKTSELISAMERYPISLDIEVVSSGIKITDHHKRPMRIACGHFSTSTEKGRLGHSLWEIATKNADTILH